jgi:flavin reductase
MRAGMAGETRVIEQKTFREAMARLGASVNIITTDGPGGRRGFTASAVCSVTDKPPTLLVCLNRNSDSNQALKDNKVVCVNTLTSDQQHLSPIFAGMTEHDYDGRFAATNWTTLSTGAPVMLDAGVSFDCRIVQITEVGTHSVFFCEVEAVHLGPQPEALIYFGREYHRIRVD